MTDLQSLIGPEAVAWLAGAWAAVKIINVVADVALGKLLTKLRLPSGCNGNGNGAGHARVAALAAEQDDLRAQMRDGFTGITSKMEAQHAALGTKIDDTAGELHRRISELRDDFNNSRVKVALDFASKKDLDKAEERLRREIDTRAPARRAARQ